MYSLNKVTRTTRNADASLSSDSVKSNETQNETKRNRKAERKNLFQIFPYSILFYFKLIIIAYVSCLLKINGLVGSFFSLLGFNCRRHSFDAVSGSISSFFGSLSHVWSLFFFVVHLVLIKQKKKQFLAIDPVLFYLIFY